MKILLMEHGATLEDLYLMETGYIHEQVPKDLQPLMSHRYNAVHRMLMDDFDNEINHAATHACTQYPRKEIASSSEEGSKINYRRYVYYDGMCKYK